MGDFVVIVNGYPKYSVVSDDPDAKAKCEAEASAWRRSLQGQGAECKIELRQNVDGDLVDANFSKPKTDKGSK